MTPEKFIALWNGNPLTERGAKKKVGPDGSVGDGWADVWKPDRERIIIHTHFREKLESDPDFRDFRREGCGLPGKSLDYANAIEPITRRPHEHTLRN